MSEAFLPNIAETQPVSQAYERVRMLTSDIVFDQEQQQLETQINEDAALNRLNELRQQATNATKRYYDELREGNSDEAQAQDAVIEACRAERDSYPLETRRTYDFLAEQIYGLEGEYRTWIIPSGSFEANAILDLINAAPAFQQTDPDKAPMRGYQQNTREAWQYVADAEIRDYLDKRVFFDTDNRMMHVSKTPKIRIVTPPGETIDIPLDLVVNAASFESWRGRESRGSGKDVSGEYGSSYDRRIPSLEVIKHYASLPSELPAVDSINLYVQPDGIIFGDNGEGDSHRIAAAILRGDKTIKADQVTIRCVDQNWIRPSQTQEQQTN